MSAPLAVRGLTKRYPGFTLDRVSFTLRPGTITGFIGRNGAGKSTTLKCLLNLVHPDSGEVSFFGMDPRGSEELACRALVGFVPGAFGSYPQKRLSAVAEVTRRFYPKWDGAMYRRCLERFQLEEGKRVRELSAGMQVKFALALALSHHARLLLLDEPTSGLDPVSREELLELFTQLCREEGATVLFSTHMTADLERCAQDILYLRSGQLVAQGPLEEFLTRNGDTDLGRVMLKLEREVAAS